MSTIDIIIPTMWKSDDFISTINSYCDCRFIDQIIIIDNNYMERPKSDILDHSKITLINHGKNLYVNPSWNEGYYRSKSNVIGILNDDIDVHSDIFKLITEMDFSDVDLMGVNLRGYPDNYTIGNSSNNDDIIEKINVNYSQPIGGQAWAFGICMFIKRSSYRIIPSLYQVWFGDDYLVQRCKSIYTLKSNKIKGKISSTLTKLSKDVDIIKRMRQDAKNVYYFNHFKNGKNWDIIKKILNNLESDSVL